MNESPTNEVRVDTESGTLIVKHLRLTDHAVLRECRHWSQGNRGAAVELAELMDTDLSNFATQALTIGSAAMSAAAGHQESYGIEQLVAEVEQRSTQASVAASERTEAAVIQASTLMEKASEQTKRAVVDAGTTAQKAFASSVETAHKELSTQISTLLGGEQPQLLLQLKPLLDGFSRTLEERALGQTSTMLEKVSKQFDPADPASPMAQQMRALSETQARYASEASEQQRGVSDKLEALAAGLVATKATELALSRTAAKGVTYEDQIHALLAEIATGLGDEYTETGNVVGMRTRSKKGDGVLSVPGGEARLVLEMTDSPRTSWSAYLKEAEDNRGAQASLGLVRSTSQLSGGPVLTLGARRVVMAFDPETDDVHLLRCVIQLLRMSAVAASQRAESGELDIANERIAAALQSLQRIGKIRKVSGQIKASASTIDVEAESLQTELQRLLAQAQTALAGAVTYPEEAAA